MLFKFKKKKILLCNGIDPEDEYEWTLLVKKVYQDFPRFVHLHKMWNVEETPDIPEVEEDTANNIQYEEAKEGTHKQPYYRVHIGFIKDGNFVVEKSRNYSAQHIESAKITYLHHLETLQEGEYQKDTEHYDVNDVPITPAYYSSSEQPSGNRRSASMNLQSLQDMVKTVSLKSTP